jgi:chromosome segregation ATPase
LEQSISSFTERFTAQSETVAALSKEKLQLEEKLLSTNEAIEALHATLAERHENWESKREGLETTNASLSEEVATLRDQCNQLRVQQQEHENEKLQLVRRLDQEVESCQAEAQRLAADHEKLLVSCGFSREELDEMTRRLMIVAEEADMRLLRLQTFCAAASSKREAEHLRIAGSLQREAEASNNVASTWRHRAESNRADNDAQVADLKEDLESAHSVLEEQAAALQSLKILMSTQEEEHAALLIKLRVAGDEVIALRRQITDIGQQHDSAEHDCASLRLKCHEEGARRRRLEDRVEELQDVVSTLKAQRHLDSEQLLALQHRTKDSFGASPSRRSVTSASSPIFTHPSPLRET